jgi:hypothetical protein
MLWGTGRTASIVVMLAIGPSWSTREITDDQRQVRRGRIYRWSFFGMEITTLRKYCPTIFRVYLSGGVALHGDYGWNQQPGYPCSHTKDGCGNKSLGPMTPSCSFATL